MTPEEFERLLKLEKGDIKYTEAHGMRVAEAVAGLAEKDRKKLAKVARVFWRATRSWDFAALPMLAVGALADAKKIDTWYFRDHVDAAIKILIDRRPEWVDEWLRYGLDERDYPRVNWKLMRALMCAGVCEKPKGRGYIQVMAWGVQRDGDSQVPINERLMNEPDLLEDVWRFFEQDVCPFYEGSEWHQVLGDLSSQGIIDRQRLLDSTIQSLFHDIRDDARSGYVRFYRHLEPTAEERAARQSVFLELLSHRTSPVVGFALDELAQLEKQQALDGEAFLASGKSVFALKPKGQPVAALKLAAAVAKRQADLVPCAIGFALEGLTHDSPDVHKQALKMLEGWQKRLHRDHLVEIRERSINLTATARKAAEEILTASGSQLGSIAVSEELPVANRAGLEARAAGLDRRWRLLAGVEQALEALDRNELPPPLEFRLLDVRVLTSTELVAPIQSVDELLDATAHALEVIESGDEIERILDGISRLCDQRPADFELRAAPLIARLESRPEQDAVRGLRNPYLVPKAVFKLLLSWLRGRPRDTAEATNSLNAFAHLANIHAFINQRAKEVERRVIEQQPAPMLSAPTHKSGWIEPCDFVRRLKMLDTRSEIPEADLIQALLRLAPDSRARALEDARQLSGDVGRVVRWALSAEDGPTKEDRSQFALWLAAGQARSPYGELTELSPLLAGTDVAFALLPPKYEWNPIEHATEPYSYHPGGAVPLQMQLNWPQVQSTELQRLPTLALFQMTQGRMWGFGASWQTQWLTSFWPLNCESRLAAGATALCQRVNAPASSLEPNYICLLPLLEPDRPWSELAYLVCWMALASKDASSRGMGIDCLIRAIEDGRAVTQQAADVLSRLMAGEWVKLNRIADILQEIGRVSPLHTWWSADLQQEFLARLDKFPNDVHHLLTLLVEQLSELELSLATATRERLAAVKLGGKSAKLAGQLLKLQPSAANAKRSAALEQILDARIVRAQRWSQLPAAG